MGKSILGAVRLPDSDAEKNPVVVYMKNLPTPRLGELDDETLVQGFLDQGMMVIEVDYEGDPRGSCAPMPRNGIFRANWASPAIPKGR